MVMPFFCSARRSVIAPRREASIFTAHVFRHLIILFEPDRAELPLGEFTKQFDSAGAHNRLRQIIDDAKS